MTAPVLDTAGRSERRRELIDIFLVSFTGLLLEISYTRVISFKLFYYYTYLIIGLALLGIGTGAVAVALSPRLRRASMASVIGVAAGLGSLGVFLGYLTVSWVGIATLDIWDYGTWASVGALIRLVTVCLALFAPFAAVGVIIATLFGRRTDRIGTLYFADLIGAGLACGLVVFLIRYVGPPVAIMLSGLVLALVALGRAVPTRRLLAMAPAAGAVGLLLVGIITVNSINIKVDVTKQPPDQSQVMDSEWSSIFRVDSVPAADRRLLYHDGLIGSAIFAFDGNEEALTRFDTDPRSLPFAVIGDQPGNVMIIGAAGGQEILASLYYDVERTDAIELNPVTHNLLSDTYAEYAGNITQRPGVNYILDDGRSFLERSDRSYDLVWYPAPDSYAAANAATSGAFVLSESYLYTSEAIEASLDRLTPNGVLAAQFGEVDYENKPNRTARYLSTVRRALEIRGVQNPDEHVVVATSPTTLGASTVSTIMVKRTPFTPEEVARFATQVDEVDGGQVRRVPGAEANSFEDAIMLLQGDERDSWFSSYPFDVRPITDDAPYFWNFKRYSDVVADFDDPINSVDPEAGTGERVLLLLLGIAVVLALLFLLVPFRLIRKDWKAMPRKPTSALYFACLGFGFLFFEITLIQQLTLFLGYPTYSLTVTLASILVFTGLGALLSGRLSMRGWRPALGLLGALTALTVAYLEGLPALTDALFDTPLGVRVAVAFFVLAPLGVCLGMFMPIGLSAVARLTTLQREYVAWSWAVNGFASVVGSVLTTLLSMTFGFRVVLIIALAVYAVAVLALRRLMAAGAPSPSAAEPEPAEDPELVPA